MLMIQTQSFTVICNHWKHCFPPLSLSDSLLCLLQIMQDWLDQRASLTHRGLIQATYSSPTPLSLRTCVWPTDNVLKCFPFIWIFVSQYNIGSTFIYSLQETSCERSAGTLSGSMRLSQTLSRSVSWNISHQPPSLAQPKPHAHSSPRIPCQVLALCPQFQIHRVLGQGAQYETLSIILAPVSSLVSLPALPLQCGSVHCPHWWREGRFSKLLRVDPHSFEVVWLLWTIESANGPFITYVKLLELGGPKGMFQLSNGQMGIPGIPRRDIFNGASVKLGNVEENYKTKPFFFLR